MSISKTRSNTGKKAAGVSKRRVGASFDIKDSKAFEVARRVNKFLLMPVKSK